MGRVYEYRLEIMEPVYLFLFMVTVLGLMFVHFVMTDKVEAPPEAPPEPAFDTSGTNLTLNRTGVKEMSYKVFDNPKGDQSKKAIVVGINVCSPFVYQGDILRLRGCVNDANNIRALLQKKGYGKIYFLTDASATVSNFLDAFKEVEKDAKDGDTLFISMSRHGASLGGNYFENDQEVSGVNPDDGEKYSGDQGAVMHDGIIVDDCFYRLFSRLPKVRIIYWNDSCHSESQYKAANIPGIGRKRLFSVRAMPREYMPAKDKVLDLKQLEAEFPKPNKDFSATLVSISGCKDVEYSADAKIGGRFQGAFTAYGIQTVLKNPNITPAQLEKELQSVLRRNQFTQTPKATVIGDPSELIKPIFI